MIKAENIMLKFFVISLFIWVTHSTATTMERVNHDRCDTQLSLSIARNVIVTLLETQGGSRIHSMSPTGQFMIRAHESNHGTAQVIDLHTNELVEEVNTTGWEWTTIQWRKDGRSFAYKNYEYLSDGKLIIYNIKANPKGPPISNTSNPLSAQKKLSQGSWSDGGKWISSQHSKEGLRIIDASDGSVQRTIQDVTSYVWHPLEAILYYSDNKNRLFSYNPSTQKTQKLSIAGNGTLERFKSFFIKVPINPLVEYLNNKSFSAESSSSKNLQEQRNNSAISLSLGITVRTQDGYKLVVQNTKDFFMYSNIKKNQHKARPGKVTLHDMNSEGRYLVTTQLTGREWELSRDLTETEKAQREDEGFYHSGRTNTHIIREVELKVYDLQENKYFKHLFNHTAQLPHGSKSEDLSLIWKDIRSFVLGHSDDKNFLGISWLVDENNQPKITRTEKFYFRNLIHEETKVPSVFITNDDSKVLMSLSNGIIKIQALNSILPVTNIEFPVSALTNKNIGFPNYTMIKLLGLTGTGALIIEVFEAGFGGSTSHIVKVEFD
ncbi:MAG: hypothetical protein H6625_07495 [Bdellovibrionaceae bacterium]|nr:hypothetical protein [Pseudobdellovibrionaceae bacterium]